MPDDPRQTNGTMSGLGPATRPGVPQGYSVTSTSTPPSAPLYGSTPATSLADMARRAGARDQTARDQTALGLSLATLYRVLRPTSTETQAQENLGLGRPPTAGPYGSTTAISADALARKAGKR
jgi:hypothetical protein